MDHRDGPIDYTNVLTIPEFANYKLHIILFGLELES